MSVLNNTAARTSARRNRHAAALNQPLRWEVGVIRERRGVGLVGSGKGVGNGYYNDDIGRDGLDGDEAIAQNEFMRNNRRA